jgi:hypothetical protein
MMMSVLPVVALTVIGSLYTAIVLPVGVHLHLMILCIPLYVKLNSLTAEQFEENKGLMHTHSLSSGSPMFCVYA